jgi:uncharacterized protein YecE (DUF72 family)
MKKTEILPGCSSFYNKQWTDIFYPADLPSKEWFAYYCEHFNTYELNATFYKFPTPKILQNWYKKSPDGFLFAVKAPKLITHIKKFIECEREIAEFYVACREGLNDKLGCVLFQTPPSFHYSRERLDRIISNLNPNIQNVVEFRNESWWIKEVYEAFIKNKLIFCSVNYPGLPTTVIETTSIGYIRLHGNPKLFYSEYSPEELNKMFEEIRCTKNLKKVFIYFNNTASTAGIVNALAIKHMGALA